MYMITTKNTVLTGWKKKFMLLYFSVNEINGFLQDQGKVCSTIKDFTKCLHTFSVYL